MTGDASTLPPAPAAGAGSAPRARLMPLYTAMVTVSALCVLVVAFLAHRPGPGELPGLLALLALGAASGRLRAGEGEAQIDLSFTAAILLSAIPVSGPVGAAVLGAVVPLLDLRRVPALALVFNSSMTCLVGGLSGLAYLALGGWVPLPAGADGLQLLLHVALPLVGADVALCLINAALVAVMIWLHEEPGWRLTVEPFVATLPVYLGYAVTAFLFVVLWGPGGLGVLAAAFIVAPLLVARWAYVQYIVEARSRQRILEALASASQSPDWSVRRSRRIATVVALFEPHLDLSKQSASALRYATPLHDIGTVAIPTHVLKQQSTELNDDDLRILREHPATAFEAIRDIDFLADAADAVRHHHERWDGSGYPDGLRGTTIPPAARVLAIIDVYEAIAWPDEAHWPEHHDDAMAQIRRRSGTDFDPRLVSLFEQAMVDAPAALAEAVEDSGSGSVTARPRRPGRPAHRPPLRHAHPQVGDAISAAQRRGSVGPGDPARDAAGEASVASQRVGRGGRIGSDGGPPDRAGLIWLVVSLATLLSVVLIVGGERPDAAVAERTVLLVYFLTLVVAERYRMRLRWRLETAPTAWAAGVALALTVGLPGNTTLSLDTVAIVGVVIAAQAVDWVTVQVRRPARERREALVDAAIRSLTVLLVCLIVRDLPWDGAPLTEYLVAWPPWLQALTMMIVVACVLLAETPGRAVHRERSAPSPFGREVLEEIRSNVALGSAMAATAVLLAMAERVLGLVAVPLLLLPLAVTQLALRRYLTTSLAYRQSVQALSRLPELAGFVPAGHASRVAGLAVAIGRRMALSDREIVDLEYAALLHDIGQLSLRRPLPHGATVLAAAADQERIAHGGARVVAQTGTLDDVADIVRHQAVPYHRVMGSRSRLPLASRIVNVANAYEDYLRAYEPPGTGSAEPGGTRRSGEPGRPDRPDRPGRPDEQGEPGAGAGEAVADAVERLYLGLGHEFDPKVVRACESHVLREAAPTTATLASPPTYAPAGGAGAAGLRGVPRRLLRRHDPVRAHERQRAAPDPTASMPGPRAGPGAGSRAGPGAGPGAGPRAGPGAGAGDADGSALPGRKADRL